jgi:hypothetical protein
VSLTCTSGNSVEHCESVTIECKSLLMEEGASLHQHGKQGNY